MLDDEDDPKILIFVLSNQKTQKNMEPYSEVRNDYEDDDEIIHIDTWKTGDDDEEGVVAAVVLPPYYRHNVFYKSKEAMQSEKVEEAIKEVVKDDIAIDTTVKSFDWYGFKRYVDDYDPKTHGGNDPEIVLKDMLYGLGMFIDPEGFKYMNGFKRFLNWLKVKFKNP